MKNSDATGSNRVGAHSDRLGPEQRNRWLDELSEGPPGNHVDVVVIGGGVTGAGCALDLALRGRSVLLLEQRDLASGTSSRSSKLIHGGLRYLQRLELGLVRESLAERRLLLNRLAPHLVKPVRFLYPIRGGWRERVRTGAGIALYSAMAGAGAKGAGAHRHWGARGVRRLAPGLDPAVTKGGISYFDGQTDDARLVVAIARTAAGFGARLLTSTRVTELAVADGAVRGVVARCGETGRTFTVHCDAVINATGVWTSQIEELAAPAPIARTRLRASLQRTHIRASKGIHLLVPRERIDLDCGLIVPTPPSVLFVVPWDDRWIIGTTDSDWNLDYAHPAASSADIDLLLERLNGVLADPITREDICGVYAGLRPLVAGDAAESAKLSREHSVTRVMPGLVTVAGGKYTTYRVMAADTVETALAEAEKANGRPPANLPRRRRNAAARRSATSVTRLVGAHGYEERLLRHDEIAARAGLPRATVAALLDRHGDRIDEVLELVADAPGLGRPLAEGHHYLRAEVVHAVRAEAALHLDDVLTRRTRLSVESWDRGTEVAADTAELMGAELGWSPEQIRNEVAHYLARVAAERDSQTRPDDQTADAARLGAPDIRQ